MRAGRFAAILVGLGLAAGWAAWAAGESAPPEGPPAIAPAAPDEGEGGAAPPNPFGTAAGTRKDAVPGYVELSTGQKIPGRLYTTRAKRLKIFNVERKVYEYVPVPAVRRMEATVEWERLEKEWRFKEPGSPEKVETGRTYPVRQIRWRLILRNDHEIVGHLLGQPLYVEEGGHVQRLLLSMRQKGTFGQTLQDLMYVRTVALGTEAYEEAKRSAEQEAGSEQGGGGDAQADEPPAAPDKN